MTGNSFENDFVSKETASSVSFELFPYGKDSLDIVVPKYTSVTFDEFTENYNFYSENVHHSHNWEIIKGSSSEKRDPRKCEIQGFLPS